MTDFDAWSYQEFLESKRITANSTGFEIDRNQINPKLFDFQKDLVQWAIRKGRAAIFADTGLGKTFMQLEWARLTDKTTLIIAPLSVARQTITEGRKINVDVHYTRNGNDLKKINITNYEIVEKFNPSAFDAVILDESSILKGLAGKTRIKLTEMFSKTRFRLCCTATPAPNDITEIANHAEFLGIMTRIDMLSTFFVHDANGWRLKKHAEKPFYKWLASWGMSIKKPSDLGYPNNGYVLPELKINPIFVHTSFKPDGALFWNGLKGITQRAEVRKGTVKERIQKTVDLVNESLEQWIVWCGLNKESAALSRFIEGSIEIKGSDPPEVKAERIEAFQDGKFRVLITKPKIAGFGMNFQNCRNMAFVGLSDSWESYYQCIRRCWRFGQNQTVNVYIILSEAESAIYENVMKKEAEATRMSENLIANVKEFEKTEIGKVSAGEFHYETEIVEGKNFKIMLGDCVERIKEIKNETIDLSVFSPPFLSLYTYSATERDIGNSKNEEEFFKHFGFVIKELLRITRLGRNCCVHISQVPAMLVRDGYIGLKDFRGRTIQTFEEHGWIYHGEVCIDKDPQALRNGTNVLTKDGWKPIETLKIGDKVVGRDGQLTEVIGVWPHESRTMYRVTFSDGFSVDCDANHLWTVRPLGRKWNCVLENQWITMRTDELYGNTHTPSGRPRYEIPIVAPVDYGKDIRLPIDPYVLGVLLGDGSFSQRSTVEIMIGPEIAEKIRHKLPKGCELIQRPYGEKTGVYRYTITYPEWHVNPIVECLRELKLMGLRAWEKFIPDIYMLASPPQRLELLQGLMDTDGTCKKNGQPYFATVSKYLAEGLCELVQSLGGLATIATEVPTYKYKNEHKEGRMRYRVTPSLFMCPFCLERKAQRWHKNRSIARRIVAIDKVDKSECTCITVANQDGLFVTEYYIVTHNSQAIRTHSKGLLFVQLKKDASWLRPALADYILVFRKPGENQIPIKPDLTNDEWIEWARPVWYGIKESDTLNYREARENDDERHICPLQLGTIERCIRLWSNPGETIFSPFAGIGSEGYMSLRLNRKFIGIELKRSYFEVAVRNLQEIENYGQQLLFQDS